MRAKPTLLLLCFAGCTCLAEPEADTSPPSVKMVIEWQEAEGATESRTFSDLDADSTISIGKDHPILVTYAGSDEEGLQSIHLDYDMIYYGEGGAARPIPVAIERVSPCPTTSLKETHEFDPGGRSWRCKLTARSKNWVGTIARSPSITVETR